MSLVVYDQTQDDDDDDDDESSLSTSSSSEGEHSDSASSVLPVVVNKRERDQVSTSHDIDIKRQKGVDFSSPRPPPSQHFVPPQVALRGERINRISESFECLTDKTSKSLIQIDTEK